MAHVYTMHCTNGLGEQYLCKVNRSIGVQLELDDDLLVCMCAVCVFAFTLYINLYVILFLLCHNILLWIVHIL